MTEERPQKRFKRPDVQQTKRARLFEDMIEKSTLNKVQLTHSEILLGLELARLMLHVPGSKIPLIDREALLWEIIDLDVDPIIYERFAYRLCRACRLTKKGMICAIAFSKKRNEYVLLVSQNSGSSCSVSVERDRPSEVGAFGIIYMALGKLLGKDLLTEACDFDIEELGNKMVAHMSSGIVSESHTLYIQGPHTNYEAKTEVMRHIITEICRFSNGMGFDPSGGNLFDEIDHFEQVKFPGLMVIQTMIAIEYIKQLEGVQPNSIYSKPIVVPALTMIEHNMEGVADSINEMMYISNKNNMRVAAIVSLSYGGHCITLVVIRPEEGRKFERIAIIDPTENASDAVLDFIDELKLIYKDVVLRTSGFQDKDGPCCIYSSLIAVSFARTGFINKAPLISDLSLMYKYILKRMFRDFQALGVNEPYMDTDLPIMRKWFDSLASFK